MTIVTKIYTTVSARLLALFRGRMRQASQQQKKTQVIAASLPAIAQQHSDAWTEAMECAARFVDPGKSSQCTHGNDMMDLLSITQDKLKEDSGKLDALAAEIAECRAKIAKETVDAKRCKMAEQLAALVTEEDALRKELKLIEADVNKPEDAATAVDPEMRREELKARLPEDVERDKLKKLIAREISLADQLGHVRDGDNPADPTPSY